MIAGVDEAGRGPVLGPLVICGVLFTREGLAGLREAGVKDSKLLSPRRREELAKLIMKRALKVKLVELPPSRIDKLRLTHKLNLNEIEARHVAEILNYLKPKLAYVDSVDPDPRLFKHRLQRHLRARVKLVVESFADQKYEVVGAASILAKVRRDRRVASLRRRYGDFGSGYASDPRTIAFLERWVRERGKLPSFARRSWETAQRILSRFSPEQTRLF